MVTRLEVVADEICELTAAIDAALDLLLSFGEQPKDAA